MRIDVEKVLIIGPMSVKEHFFSEAQALGVVQFISPFAPPVERPREIELLVEAIHILKRRVPIAPIKGAQADLRQGSALALHIVEENERLERSHEHMRYLEKQIARIEVFGDFSLGELEDLYERTGRRVRFFYAKENEQLAEAVAGQPDLVYIGSHSDLAYFISFDRENRSYTPLIEMKIERSLGELQSELSATRRITDALDADLALFTRELHFLEQSLIDELNRYHLLQARETAEISLAGELFHVMGWVPKNKRALLETLCDKVAVHYAPIAEEEGDAIPTYLENEGLLRSGEDLIAVYDTPSRVDRDPSTWVLFSFALFFSMIIADAGYGLLLLIIAFYLRRKYAGKRGVIQRITRLTFMLSIGCMVWGVLAASYFGINLSPVSPFRQVSPIHWMAHQKAAYYIEHKPPAYEHQLHEYPELKSEQAPLGYLMKVPKEGGGYAIYEDFSNSAMLELVLFLGALHISFGLLRYADKNWANVGWVIGIIGGYVYFPALIHATSLIHYLFHLPPAVGALIGPYLLYGGVLLAFVLALIQKRLAGLVEPMQVIQIFADIMSYLRIYALSLAGMIMASTFNGIGMKMPWYLGMWIILAGHGINFTLAIIGGIIHGLRLNFIEWYHYSFEGGGKPFQPLALIDVD